MEGGGGCCDSAKCDGLRRPDCGNLNHFLIQGLVLYVEVLDLLLYSEVLVGAKPKKSKYPMLNDV